MTEENKKNKEQADKSQAAAQPESPEREIKKERVRVPLLLDFSLSVAKMTIVVVAILTVVISVFSGASLVMTIVRGASALLAMGLFFWIVNWWIAAHSLEAVRKELLDNLKADHPTHSTLEKVA